MRSIWGAVSGIALLMRQGHTSSIDMPIASDQSTTGSDDELRTN